jgi:hypothetical protein
MWTYMWQQPVECAWRLAVRLRACRGQSAEWRGQSAEWRGQSAERRAQSAECLEGTVCRAIKVGARILDEAQAGAQPETVFVSRAGTG